MPRLILTKEAAQWHGFGSDFFGRLKQIPAGGLGEKGPNEVYHQPLLDEEIKAANDLGLSLLLVQATEGRFLPQNA